MITLHTTVYTETEPSLILRDPMIVGNSAQIGAVGVTGSANSASVIIVGPLLKITKKADPNLVLPGHYLVYTITVFNEDALVRPDSIAATNLVISDVLPEYSTFINATHGGYYDPLSNNVVFKLPGPLAPGATQDIAFRVLVAPDTDSNTTIANKKTEFMARSDEIHLKDVLGYNTVNVKTAPPENAGDTVQYAGLILNERY